jgi:hypothetical protein
MVQQIIIIALFLAALGYLGYIIYKNFTDSGCSSGCGSCGLDINKIRKHLEKNAVK